MRLGGRQLIASRCADATPRAGGSSYPLGSGAWCSRSAGLARGRVPSLKRRDGAAPGRSVRSAVLRSTAEAAASPYRRSNRGDSVNYRRAFARNCVRLGGPAQLSLLTFGAGNHVVGADPFVDALAWRYQRVRISGLRQRWSPRHLPARQVERSRRGESPSRRVAESPRWPTRRCTESQSRRVVESQSRSGAEPTAFTAVGEQSPRLCDSAPLRSSNFSVGPRIRRSDRPAPGE